MSKKLFRATCEVEVFFLSDSAVPGDMEIEDFAREEVSNNGVSVAGVRLVTNIKNVPSEWRDSLPYDAGTENTKTIADLLAEVNP
jgi:hypothetical protein